MRAARNELLLFEFSGSPIRAAVVDGEAWFALADVTALLGHCDPIAALHAHVDPDDTAIVEVGAPGGSRLRICAVADFGLYRLTATAMPAAARAAPGPATLTI
jgi:prophage antirepressor-like protein